MTQPLPRLTRLLGLLALIVLPATACSGANDQGPKGTPPPITDSDDEGIETEMVEEKPLPPSPIATDPKPGADVEASRINEEGKALVQQRNFKEALEKFRAALRLFPLSNAIFNVGSMLYTLGEHHEAFPYLQRTLKSPLAPEQHQVVVQYRDDVLAKLKATHKDILFETNPPGARLVLDDKALPFPSPARLLVPYGKAVVVAHYPGFALKEVVIESTPENPPKDISIRLAIQNAQGRATIRCPAETDVFIDSAIRGYQVVTDKLSAGKHTIRCGKGPKSKAFEREIEVKAGRAKTFDFSGERQ